MKKCLLSISLLLGLILSGIGQTTILFENFDTGIPVSWTQTANAGSDGWLAGNYSSLSSMYWNIPDNGSNFVASNDDQCNCDKAMDRLISPSLDVSPLTQVALSFDAYLNDGGQLGVTEFALVEYSLDNGVSWNFTGAIAENPEWQTIHINLTDEIGGAANVLLSFRYSDGGMWGYGCAIDNVQVYEPVANDAELSDFSHPFWFPNLAEFTGTIVNMGSDTITSIDLSWSDGTNTYVDNLSGLSIPMFGTYEYTHSTAYSGTPGSVDFIDMFVSLPGDGNPLNDMIGGEALTPMSSIPARKVVVEEICGTWCGWCPRGTVAMEELSDSSDFIGIHIHQGDPMALDVYGDPYSIATNLTGYPHGSADRVLVGDPSYLNQYYVSQKQEYAPAIMEITNIVLNGDTLSFDVNAEMVIEGPYDFRMNAVLIENNITGTGSGYDQVNFYSGGANGVMGGYEALPSPVPAANMEYNMTARAMLGDFWGDTSVFPAVVVDGQNYTASFSYVIPSDQNPANLDIIGILYFHDNGSGRIVNGVEVPVLLGINENSLSDPQIIVYPNPASDYIHIALADNSDIQLQLVDLNGKKLYETELKGKEAYIDIRSLNAGMYVLELTINGRKYAKRIAVN